jgi:hypothetical protein
VVGVYVATGELVEVGPGEHLSGHAVCEPGDTATSGGYHHMRGALSSPASSFPLMDGASPVGWTTLFLNDAAATKSSVMMPMVICLDTTP